MTPDDPLGPGFVAYSHDSHDKMWRLEVRGLRFTLTDYSGSEGIERPLRRMTGRPSRGQLMEAIAVHAGFEVAEELVALLEQEYPDSLRDAAT